MPALHRHRFLLLASLALLGAAVGVLATLLSPRGFVEARDTAWGPDGAAAATGFGDRAGAGLCGVDVEGRRVAIRGCHSYAGPAIVEVDSERFVVWEHDDHQVAVGRLGPGGEPARTVFLPRPRTALGTRLPRTDVRADGDRLAVWYHGGRVVTVDTDLVVWPGGAPEIASARLGAGSVVVLLGAIALIVAFLGVSGWTLGLPGRLHDARRRGRAVTATLPAAGGALVIDGHPWEVALERARAFGARLDALRGETVTLVLSSSVRAGDAYRLHDRLEIEQLWPGDFPRAVTHARALRTRTIAIAVLAAATLALGLDLYLAL